MRISIVVLIVVLTGSVISWGQNLVPNPGFEVYKNCPGGPTEAAHEFTVADWRPATSGTPDHFNMCSDGEANVPHNWAGVSDAFEGKGYAGIYMWMNDTHDYREYLQCQLIQPLLKDSLYKISFRHKLSSYSMFAIDRIGLLLADDIIHSRHDNVLLLTPQMAVVRDSALTENTGLWELATMTYKANGNERCIVIGNFWSNTDTHYYEIQFRPMQQMMLSQSAYYYIDDVRVIPNYVVKQQHTFDLPAFTPTGAELNKNYVLKNIQFELNSYKLIPPSFEELDQVAEYLLKNSKVRVQFFGHTDDLGSDAYNLKLSENRAKTVAGYLSSLGIQSSRIEIFSYGESKPLIKENTEEARAVNRRVEIRFIK